MLTIVARYPDVRAAELFVRGSALGLNWEHGVRLEHAAVADTWTLKLSSPAAAPPAAPTTQLRFKVLLNDSVWARGADTMVDVPRDGSDSLVECFPFFFGERSRVEWLKELWSPQLNNIRDVSVLLPPSFDENPFKVYRNVVVMHDGQNLYDPQTASFGATWRVDETINHCVGVGSIEEVVVVGVESKDRLNELPPVHDSVRNSGGLLGRYLDFIEQSVFPAVASHWPGRISIERNRLGVIGSSLGGLASFHAVWARSHVFGRCGCLSGSFMWGGTARFLNSALRLSPPPNPVAIYLDSGDSGKGQDGMQETRKVRDFLLETGWVLDKDLFYFLDHGAKHNEAAWSARLWRPFTALYSPRSERAAPTPSVRLLH